MDKNVLEPPKSLTATVRQLKKEYGGAVSALNAVTASTRGKYRRKRSKCSRPTPKKLKKSSESFKLPPRKVDPPKPKKTRLSESDIKLRAMVENAQPGMTHTLQEIADVMGISRERVRQIQDQALRKVYFYLAKIAKADNIDLDELKR
jgi:transcriptional regulator with XRE-family HTH domain